jgi:hypothetical protein
MSCLGWVTYVKLQTGFMAIFSELQRERACKVRGFVCACIDA